MGQTWILGALINIVGSVLINLGTNIMKLGHNKRAFMECADEEKPSIVKFKEWRIGIGIYVLGNLCNFASFAFAAQSLLSALGSVQFVANVFFASLVLKEKVTKIVLLATACIIGGCLLLVIFGSHDSETFTADELIELYNEPPYIVYLVMSAVFAFGTYIAYIHGKHVARNHVRNNAVCKKQPFWVQVMPVAYSIYSGLIGTQSVVFSKSLSVLLRLTFKGENQMTSWFTYVMLICFLITAFFFMARLNQGLSMFPAMLIVPMMQICWTLFSIVSGMLYWQEYKVFTVLMAAMFTIGVLIVFVGVYLLTLNAKIQYEQEDAEIAEQLSKCSSFVEDSMPSRVFSHACTRHPSATSMQHTNPIYDPNPNGDDPSRPRKHDMMDTLIFTSLASTMGGSKAHIGQSLRGGWHGPHLPHRHSNSGSTQTDRIVASHQLNSTVCTDLNASKDSRRSDESSMMGTLKRSLRHLAHDFSIFDSDAAKGVVGLNTPLALFTSPTPDRVGSRARKYNANGHRDTASVTDSNASELGHDHIAAELPVSRFYHGDNTGGPTLGRLQTIREVSSSANLARYLESAEDAEDADPSAVRGVTTPSCSSRSQTPTPRQNSNPMDVRSVGDAKASLNSTKRTRMKHFDAAANTQDVPEIQDSPKKASRLPFSSSIAGDRTPRTTMDDGNQRDHDRKSDDDSIMERDSGYPSTPSNSTGGVRMGVPNTMNPQPAVACLVPKTGSEGRHRRLEDPYQTPMFSSSPSTSAVSSRQTLHTIPHGEGDHRPVALQQQTHTVPVFVQRPLDARVQDFDNDLLQKRWSVHDRGIEDIQQHSSDGYAHVSSPLRHGNSRAEPAGIYTNMQRAQVLQLQHSSGGDISHSRRSSAVLRFASPGHEAVEKAMVQTDDIHFQRPSTSSPRMYSDMLDQGINSVGQIETGMNRVRSTSNLTAAGYQRSPMQRSSFGGSVPHHGTSPLRIPLPHLHSSGPMGQPSTQMAALEVHSSGLSIRQSSPQRISLASNTFSHAGLRPTQGHSTQPRTLSISRSWNAAGSSSGR